MRKQPYNYDIGGEVLEFRSSDKRDYVIMDPSDAYPKKELKGWRRHVTLDKPVVTFVLDEVSARPGAEIEARFHPGNDMEIHDRYVMLHGEKGKMALIPVIDGGFTIRPGRHACQPVNATRRFFWVRYFGTVVNAGSGKTIIGTIVLPVTDDSEASKIAQSVKRTVDSSGNLEVSFKKGGKTYRYSFKNGSDGLVLEK